MKRVLLAGLLCPSVASAADTLVLRGAVDGPVLATTATYAVMSLWLLDDRAPATTTSVLPGGIDASFAGAPASEGAVPLASDALAFGGAGLGLLAAPLYGATYRGAGAGQGARAAVAHAVVYAETLAISVTLTDIVKTASRRPRPYTHAEGFVIEDGDDQRSFPSGHTSSAGAASFGFVHQVVLTNDLSPGAVVGLYGLATAWTASTGVLRVAAHKHYPTDVIMGGILGASVGIVVPELHRASRLRVTAGLGPGGQRVAVSGRW